MSTMIFTTRDLAKLDQHFVRRIRGQDAPVKRIIRKGYKCFNETNSVDWMFKRTMTLDNF